MSKTFSFVFYFNCMDGKTVISRPGAVVNILIEENRLKDIPVIRAKHYNFCNLNLRNCCIPLNYPPSLSNHQF